MNIPNYPSRPNGTLVNLEKFPLLIFPAMELISNYFGTIFGFP